jgi:hypothetical protein
MLKLIPSLGSGSFGGCALSFGLVFLDFLDALSDEEAAEPEFNYSLGALLVNFKFLTPPSSSLDHCITFGYADKLPARGAATVTPRSFWRALLWGIIAGGAVLLADDLPSLI